MHYRAIQRSNGHGKCASLQEKPVQKQQPEHRPEEDIGLPRSIVHHLKKVSRYGHDDAADSQTIAQSLEVQKLDQLSSFASSQKEETDLEQNEENTTIQRHLPIQIPTSSPGLTTFAYQRALRNRISASKLSKDGTYDLTKYTPTFIHDALMLPGSLANLLGKGSSEDVVNRITPAVLPQFHSHIDVESLQPCLLRSSKPQAYVQGMLLFGQGKASRDAVHRHYRPGAKRRKVGVECDVWVEVPPAEQEVIGHGWRLERRTIQAHVWIWSGEVEDCKGGECRDWRLEDYFAGNLDEKLPMRVESDATGDEQDDLESNEERGGTVTLVVEEGALIVGKHGRPAYASLERHTWLE